MSDLVIAEPTMVVLGKLGEAYGVRGWIRVHPHADDPDAWCDLPAWWVGKEGQPIGTWRQVALKECKWHGDGLVALLDGVADRTAAEALKGSLIGAWRDDLPEPDEDEYYWGDLIGLGVVNQAGESLGTVAGLIETGASDVLQVQETLASGEIQERLLPFVAAVVLQVDVAAGRITVDWQRDW